MASTYWNDAENEALDGLPWLAQLFYLRALRRSMNYSTGMVGQRPHGTSWAVLGRLIYVEPARGRPAEDAGTPSTKALRFAVDLLARAGLVEVKSQDRCLLFFLPLADRDTSVSGNRGRRRADVGQSNRGRPDTNNDGGSDEIKGSIGAEQDSRIGAGIRYPISDSSCTRKKKESANALLSGNPAAANRDAVCRVLEHLNERTGARFETHRSGKPTKAAILVGARLAEHGAEALMAVIDRKAAEWMQDAHMRQFLRPSTLFRPEKCEEYVSQLSLPQRTQRLTSNREVMDEWMASEKIIDGTCRHD